MGNTFNGISEEVVKPVEKPPKIVKQSKPHMTPQKLAVKKASAPLKVKSPFSKTPSKAPPGVFAKAELKNRTPKKKINEKFIVSPRSPKRPITSNKPHTTPVKPKTEPISPAKQTVPVQRTPFITVGTSSTGKGTPPEKTEKLLEPKKELDEEVIYQC